MVVWIGAGRMTVYVEEEAHKSALNEKLALLKIEVVPLKSRDFR
jgi:hypothetical protein